jgi:hypothetical protein
MVAAPHTMRAVVFKGPGVVAVEDRPVPRIQEQPMSSSKYGPQLFVVQICTSIAAS